LQRFTEALYDEAANLTYTALTGVRKQSVSDAERLLSASVADFMKKNNYLAEEEYVRTISNWRAACDERGLSELTRSKYNYQLLNYVIEELMPWFKEYDFSHLEVNR
jgi:glutamyl-tRNA reductase